jgi:hypothetical protein
MHDVNGKPLHIGDEVFTYAYGLTIIKAVKEEYDMHKGGALIECIGVGRGGGSVEIRTHEQRAVKVRSWRAMAEEALGVQNACNLSGVVHSFSTIITEVRTRLEAEGKGGTDAVNTHPVCILFADKVAHLTGTQGFGNDGVGAAYTWAHDLTSKKGG